MDYSVVPRYFFKGYKCIGLVNFREYFFSAIGHAFILSAAMDSLVAAIFSLYVDICQPCVKAG
jgi:hypothetical protein